MHYSCIFLQRRCKPTTPSVLHRLAILRFMGGGRRTFPGGLNKWQWKRLHEKKAREKEKRLLDQEKQIYQARIRSEIRSKLSAAPQNPNSGPDPDQPGPNYGPLSPKEHIKALADRFMKEGAEDLWNEADGPVKTPATPRATAKKGGNGETIDLRKLFLRNSGFTDNYSVSEGSNLELSNDISSRARRFSSCSVGLMGLGCNLKGHCANGILMSSNNWLISRRISSYTRGLEVMCGHGGGILKNLDNILALKCYSVDARSNKSGERFNLAKNRSSKSEEGSHSKGSLFSSSSGGKVRWPRFRANRNAMNSSDDESDDHEDDDVKEEENDEERRSRTNGRRMVSSAALGKYDVKIKKKRVPLNVLEQEYDLSRHVEIIRKEFSKRSLEEQHGEGKNEEETIYSSKSQDTQCSGLCANDQGSGGYTIHLPSRQRCFGQS